MFCLHLWVPLTNAGFLQGRTATESNELGTAPPR
jgi:hypothetical protein